MYKYKTLEIDSFAFADTYTPAFLIAETALINSGAWEGGELPLLMESPVRYGAKFIDPLTDFGFRRLFGNPSGKKFLISFLNAVFSPEPPLSDIIYNPAEVVGSNEDSKKVIFDISCAGENGEQIILEMQRANQSWFKNRMVYYNSRLINEQLPKGTRPTQYNINGAYSVAVLNFNLPDTPEHTYIHDVCNYYRGTQKIFSTKQRYKFIELPKFNKRIDELTTMLDNWLYLLKHMHGMQDVSPALNQGIFRDAFEIAAISNLTKEEHIMYRSIEQDQFDYEHTIEFAAEEAAKEGLKNGLKNGLKKGLKEGRQEGRQEGLKEGRQEGLKEGRQEGLKEGRQEAEASTTRAIVCSLVSKTDFDDLRIAELACTDEQFVKSVRQELEN